MAFVLIVIGALLGAAVREGTGFLLGGVIGWLIWRSVQQQREIEALKRGASASPAALPAQRRALDPAPEAEAAPATEAVPAAEHDYPAWIAPQPADAAQAGHTEAALPPLPPSPPSIAARAFAAARDWFLGGNTIVKAGVGILFIGLAFLAKYASEHVSLPVELRLASIAAVAIALLGLGWSLRESRAAYAQVLQGGAIAVLYLTLFAAFKFYGVIGGGAAFVLMATVAALAAALAVLQDARALAAIGALGGYATPLLISTGSGNHVALFGYYFVLGAGVAAVAWFRTWRELNLIAFAFTAGVGTLWGVLSYRSHHYLSAQGFLLLFFMLFVAVLLLPARRVAATLDAPVPQSERWVNGSLLFGLPTVAFGLQYGLVQHTRWGVALSALALAMFYVALAAALRGKAKLALMFEGCLAVGTVFLTLVIPFALDPRSTAGAWALEGAGLVWLGWRQARRLARGFGYALIVVAGGLLFHALQDHPSPERWLNATALAGLMLAAGALIAAFVVQRHAPPAEGVGERIAEPLLIFWALLAIAGTVFLQVFALVEPLERLSALIAALGLTGLLFVALAAKLQ